MNVKMEPAVCSGGLPKQTASSNQHCKSYLRPESVSTLKSEIGTLLLCLEFPVGQEASQIGWVLFERLLRRYVDRRISQSASQGHSGYAERTNASQRVSG